MTKRPNVLKPNLLDPNQQIKCTYWLQLSSLDNFAKEIGYTRTNGVYLNDNQPSMLRVRFETMVQWYNTNFVPVPFTNNPLNGMLKECAIKHLSNFDFYDMQRACASKVVDFVKLHYDKSTERVVVDSHKVKLSSRVSELTLDKAIKFDKLQHLSKKHPNVFPDLDKLLKIAEGIV